MLPGPHDGGGVECLPSGQRGCIGDDAGQRLAIAAEHGVGYQLAHQVDVGADLVDTLAALTRRSSSRSAWVW